MFEKEIDKARKEREAFFAASSMTLADELRRGVKVIASTEKLADVSAQLTLAIKKAGDSRVVIEPLAEGVGFSIRITPDAGDTEEIVMTPVVYEDIPGVGVKGCGMNGSFSNSSYAVETLLSVISELLG